MKIVFCLPGKNFSSNFFNSWNQTIAVLQQNQIQYAYSIAYDPVVYYTRNKILGGDNRNGRYQKPWQGQIPYDKIIWIDNDIVWQPHNVLSLIASDKPIIAGTYLMESTTQYPIVEHLDFKHLATNGVFQFLTKEDLAGKNQIFPVSYTGFGFLCMQHGILESMEYPWFQPKWVTSNNFHDFCAEDVGFCWTAQELGHKIWIDPTITVGHEKTIIL
jgi:hypothetical protein